MDGSGALQKEEQERDLSTELTLFVDRVVDEETVIKIGNLYAKTRSEEG